MLAVLLILVLVGVVMAGLMALHGVTIAILWSWFMVPVFHVQPLTVIQAMGVSLLFSYLISHLAPAAVDAPRNPGETDLAYAWRNSTIQLAKPIYRSGVILGIALIIKHLM